LAGLATFAYQAAPTFWKQYVRDMQRPVAPPSSKPRIDTWPDRGIFAAWLGHSTVLLKIDGVTILTDPVFSERAGLNFGLVTLGVKRIVAPALSLKDLPKIDLILVSHAHMDHLDTPSLRKLESDHTAVITAHATGDLFRARRYKQLTELRWGGRAAVGPITVRAIEVNHWGARMRTDTYRGYNGYVIESGRRRVLFGGDTAWTEAFREVRSAGPVDLAIMPIGAYNPWIRAHCTPEQAWRMANDSGAEFVLPVHHKTFQLGREPFEEPIDRLLAAAGSRPERVALRQIGEEIRLS
jgi:L-ascorbate metabolism protein UlaG (beta-lactamase superfamily)